MKNPNKILKRAKKIIEKNYNEENFYEQELKKTYDEYQNLKNVDSPTNDLYLEHINNLCNYINNSKRVFLKTGIFIGLFLVVVSLIIYTFTHFININNTLQENKGVDLDITYNNLENFNALTLSNNDEINELTPLQVRLKAKSAKERTIHYDLYIIEKNNNLNSNQVISRDAFMYNISTTTSNSGIKYLKNAKLNNEKILLFSNDISSSQEEVINLRMWLDGQNSLNEQNRNYLFTIYVEWKAV